MNKSRMAKFNGKVSFDIVFISIAGRSEVRKDGTLNLATLPATVAELKKQIQKHFQIPTYDQKMTFGSVTLEDRDTLAFHRLVSGDTLVVTYSHPVDMERIDQLMDQLQKTADFLKSERNELVKEHPQPVFLRRISQTIKVIDLEPRIDLLFYTSTEESVANCTFFIYAGGMNMLNEIYTILLNQSWNKVCHFDLLLLEKAILSLMVSLSAHIPMCQRCQSFQGSFQNIVRSFLRIPVHCNAPIDVPKNKHLSIAHRNEQFTVLLVVMHNALKVLANLAEINQFQMQLASMPGIVDQFEGFLLTPTLSQYPRSDVVCCVENLAYNPNTHRYIVQPRLVRALIGANNMSFAPVHYADMDPELCKMFELQLSRFFTSLIISQMTLVNKVVLEMPEAVSFVASVLNDIDHERLSKYVNAAHRFHWEDLLPYMKLVYTVNKSQWSPFHLSCLEIIILGLQLALGGESERTVLVKQGLLDYLICLPWYLPHLSRSQLRAQYVVDMVGSHIQLQPPKLTTIVKSRLAVMHYGLEKVLNSDCHTLIEEILT